MEDQPRPKPPPPPPPPPTPAALLIIMGFLAGAVVVGTSWLATRRPETEPLNMVRNVTVDYMYETDPGSASGHRDLEVATIEFLPGYVILTDSGGTAQLLAVDRLRRFSYSPTN